MGVMTTHGLGKHVDTLPTSTVEQYLYVRPILQPSSLSMQSEVLNNHQTRNSIFPFFSTTSVSVSSNSGFCFSTTP